ncbi:unnamed protein product, partial [Meganyctiphanes norvegica]
FILLMGVVLMAATAGVTVVNCRIILGHDLVEPGSQRSMEIEQPKARGFSKDTNLFTADSTEYGNWYNGTLDDGEEGINSIVEDDGEEGIISIVEPFEMSNPRRVAAGELYESDMLLTEEQWAALRGRKAINNQLYRWTEGPDGFPLVPYLFQDSVDQTAIRSGLEHWMENICIKFEETTNTDQPHLKFFDGGGCRSNVGMQYDTNGQTISIAQQCTNLGVVAHEIGHAIGFLHEQSRSDRDEYVTYLKDNVEEDRKKKNFEKGDTNNYNIPYDYTSD